MVMLLLIGAGIIVMDMVYRANAEEGTLAGPPYEEPKMEQSQQVQIVDNQSLYASDEDGSVIDVYITVLPPDQEKYSNFSDILAYKYSYYDLAEVPAAEAFFQLGDEKGPKLDFSNITSKTANSVLEPRGHSTSRSKYKSFKITLSDKVALWGGQKVLNLNFHPTDRSRVRNKLSYDFYEIIPDIPSLRTQFVRLHIKDISQGKEGEFLEYGLFTHVEQVNKRYLKAHGLDSDGQLYKANNFEFYRYPETIQLKTDKSYDKALFEQRLEIRGSEDHTKLIDMLTDLNDYSMDIDDVMQEHFNLDNYLTWLASNVIMGNNDTVSQNFFLYSPQTINNWYFIPWDCDGAWGWEDEATLDRQEEVYPDWQKGIQCLWGSRLNNRFLRKEQNVKLLDEKIEELMKLYTKDKIDSFLTEYYPAVLKSQSTPEDLAKLRSSPEKFAFSYNLLDTMPQKNYDYYVASKEKPMPFFQSPVEMKGGLAYFSWGSSFDLQDDKLKYKLEVSTTPDMQNIVISQSNLETTEVSANLPPGKYFMKATVMDSKGNTMEAFDQYEDLNDVEYTGVLEVQVD